MCNAYDIGSKLRPGHNPGWEQTARGRLGELPKLDPIRKTDPGLVVVRGETGELEPKIMRWGFSRRFNPCINNARSDRILDGKSMWAPAWKKRQRCLIAVRAFYEWSSRNGKKQAHKIRAAGLGEDDWMWMAGLWEGSAGGGIDHCYSMVTTEAGPAMEAIHHRMPVILQAGQLGDYLDDDAPTSLLAPYSGGLETPECESPFKAKPAPGAMETGSLF